MYHNRPITDFLSKDRKVISIEFFPPKNEVGGKLILKTAAEIKAIMKPDFVSITYGAGGTTRDTTAQYARLLKDDYEFQVMPHLTCVGSSRDEILEILKGFQDDGFCNIMALRGDPPIGETEFKPHPDGLPYASDLVKLIRDNFSGFSLGVAGYPEKHPESSDIETDLDNLVHKVNQGASFITTQLFFENKRYFEFVENCHKRNINIPIIPGLLPVLSLKQIRRFCDFCKAELPKELESKLEACGDDAEAVKEVGVEWAYNQIKEMLENGAPGFHLYILNRSDSAISLIKALTKDGIIESRS